MTKISVDVKPNFTILVNSSDGFEDCWNPFFTLLSRYWPNCKYPIVLNTEYKSYTNSELNIRCSRVSIENKKRLTWSECLIESLRIIETPIVLYFQEDYFIERAINVLLIEELYETMKDNKEIKYIGLTGHGNYPPFYDYEPDKRLKIVSRNSRYRISTQAALWDKETLLSYLKPTENGWMFEIFGTKRAKRRNDLFLTIDREIFNANNPIIDYQLTGVIKGRWLKTMPELFDKQGLEMDFTKRGFYKPKNPLIRKFETLFKIIKAGSLLNRNKNIAK